MRHTIFNIIILNIFSFKYPMVTRVTQYLI